MEITMNGRSAIITGGSKGIGFAIAAAFAAAGAEVAIVARGQESLDAAVAQLKSGAKAKVIGVAADVGTAEGVQKAYDGAMAAFGKLDVAVNNAGTSATGPFEKLTDAVMQTDLDLKLFAALRICRLVWPQLKERKWGRIINILNIGAKAPRANSAPTSISRAAGMAFTKVLAGEGAPHNVLVNALLVGLIDADQHVQAAKRKGIPLAEHYAAMAKDVPLGRIGRAEEFANMACFLASDAGSYITGTAINIDGGRSPVV
ncbi:MAG: SDR family oxidoreductase [Alphaproteobacteria bacterium]|nr:SDR family oxidoreductase [Alphaproteobacteria bacterium]